MTWITKIAGISAATVVLVSSCLAATRPILTSFYYPGYRKLSNLDLVMNEPMLKHLDVVMYSASIYGLRPYGPSYQLSRYTAANLERISKFLHQHHLKTKLMLSLGYWDPRKMRKTITDPATRQRFIAAVIRTLKTKRFGLSGVDIDWENVDNPVKHELRDFPFFIRELSKALRRSGLSHDLLTLDLTVNYTHEFPDPKQWINYVSWANLMGYDLYGDSLPYSELDTAFGYVTLPYPGKKPIYPNISIADALQNYHARGIMNNKLVVALPLYGVIQHVRHTSQAYNYGLRQPVIGNRRSASIPYWKIATDYGTYGHNKDGYQSHQYIFKTPAIADDYSGFWMTKGERFISYPDPIAMRQIANYVVRHHYRGLSAWELSDAMKFSNPSSLLAILSHAVSKQDKLGK